MKKPLFQKGVAHGSGGDWSDGHVNLMAFDIKSLSAYAIEHIQHFADAHANETFYAFAIDASLLCLNSVEMFEHRLTEARQNGERMTRQISDLSEVSPAELEWRKRHMDQKDDPNLDSSNTDSIIRYINRTREVLARSNVDWLYENESSVLELRANPGDWAYQGFANLEFSNGWDQALFTDHYNFAMSASDQDAAKTPYGHAMRQLLEELVRADAFTNLKRTNDFYAICVEHNY